MARSWREVAETTEFKALGASDQEAARQQYFAQVVAPRLSEEDMPIAREQFDLQTRIAKRDLPSDVTPSAAGAGRGEVNPPMAPPRGEYGSGARRGSLRAVEPYVAGTPRVQAPAEPTGTITSDPLSGPNPYSTGPTEADLVQMSKSPQTLERERAVAAVAAGRASAPSMSAAPARSAPQRMLDATIAKPEDRSLPGAALETAGDAARGIVRASQTLGGSALSAAEAGLSAVGAGDTDVARIFGMGGEAARRARTQWGNAKDPNSLTQQVFESTFTSVPLTLALGAGNASLLAMGAQSAANEFGESRDRGLSASEAAERAGFMGAAEMIGERFGLPQLQKLFASAAAKASTKEMGGILADLLVKEQVGEQVTHALQAGYEKAGTLGHRPDMTLAEFLEDAATTAKVTLGQTLLTGGLAAGAKKLAPAAAAPKKPRELIGEAHSAFDELAAAYGLPRAAVEAAKAKTDGMPADAVPGFLKRAAQAFAARGMFAKPLDDAGLAQMDPQPEQGAPSEPAAGEQESAAVVPALLEQDFSGLADEGPSAADASTTPGAVIEPIGVAAVPQGSLADQAAAVPAGDHPTDAAAHAAASSPTHDLPPPTDAQKDAGNYRKGHLRIAGLDISIENPQGSIRSGTAPDGTTWKTEMAAHYGYVRGSRAGDGDHSDIFIKPGTPPDYSGPVFVVDQIDPKTGSFDEHKAVLGASTADEARALYLANYDDSGPTRIGAITELPLPAYKSWVKDGVKRKPLGNITGAADGLGRPADAERPGAAGPADAAAVPGVGDVVPGEQHGAGAAGPAVQPLDRTEERDDAAQPEAGGDAALSAADQVPVKEGDGATTGPQDKTAAAVNETAPSERATAPAASRDGFESVEKFDKINVGPGGFIRPRPVAAGAPTYRETSADSINDLMREDRQAVPFNAFVADRPELAIGQGMNRGAHIVFRAGSVSGREHSKPMTGDLAGREYKTDLLAPRAVQTITMQAADVAKLRGLARMRLREQFDREDVGEGLVRFHRKGLERLNPPLPEVEKPAPKRRNKAPTGTPPLSRAKQTDRPEFKRWFGASKVVDEQGAPLVVYHGTQADFGEFRTSGLGSHFTGDVGVASAFGDAGHEGRVLPVFLRIKNPLRIEDNGGHHDNAKGVAEELIKSGALPADYLDDAFYSRLMADGALGNSEKFTANNVAEIERMRSMLEAQGYDGIVYRNTAEGGGDSYIAFRPQQIKSAIGNRGTFDSKQSSIILKRGGSAGGMDADTLRAEVAKITAAWKNGPPVDVVDTAADLPEAIRDALQSQDAAGEARALLEPDSGHVYLIADKLPDLETAQFALFHEVYGHYGFRLLFGPTAYAQEMARLRLSNPALAAEAKVWLDANGDAEIAARIEAGMSEAEARQEVRLLSVEEALADRAGNPEPLKGWRAFMARLQKVLRLIGWDAVARRLEAMTQAETLDLLARAREAVQGAGRVHAWTGDAVLASRKPAYASTGSRPNDYILVDGSPDLWTVPIEVEKRTAGAHVSAPVRLKVGVHRGTSNGFGQVHIEAGHGDMIGRLGMNVPEYVHSIVSGATKVYDPGRGRLLIVNERFGKHMAVVELRDEGDHYSVITAYDGRPEGKVVWSGRSSAASLPGTKPSVTGQTAPEGATPAVGSSAEPSAERTNADAQTEPPTTSPHTRIADQTGGIVGDTSAVRQLPKLSRSRQGPPRHVLRDFGQAAKTVEAIQDRYNRWKHAVEDVRKQGGAVTEANDFYSAEERYWGKVGARIDDFKDGMSAFIEAVAADKLTLDDVAMFAYAQHAKERNAYIASKRPDMADGGSGMSDADAHAHIDSARQSGAAPALERHAQTLRDWIAGTRDLLRDEGLIDQEEHDAWSKMFRYYVPLRGLEGKTEARRTGSGFNIRGKEGKEAKGRRSEAKNIIEQVVQDRTRALIRSGKNEVLRSFLQFVLDNPSANLWEVNAVERRPGVTTDDSGNRIIEEKTAIVSDDRTVSVKDGGREVRILVKDDRLREQLQNLHVEQVGRFVGALHFVNRILGRIYTSLSPTFTVLNGARDFSAATFGMIDEIGFLGAAKLWANMPKSIRESYAAELGIRSADYNAYRLSGGKTGFFDFKTIDGQAKELGAMLKDAERSPVNPIKVGRTALAIIEGINGGIENATRLAAFKAARESGKTVAEAAGISKNITVNFNRKGTMTPTLGAFFLFFNPAVQGTARIIQTLQSPKAIATLGAGMAGVFALAMLNASMGDDDDGVAWWDKIPDEVKERNIVIVLPPGSEAGNRVPKSKLGRYLKIPMPYGYNFFAVVANQAADMWRHGQSAKRGRGAAEAAAKAINAFLGAWVPVSELGRSIDNPKSMLLAGVPDALNPIGQNVLNVNSFGRKMYPDDAHSENLPDSGRYFAGSAGTIFQRSAESMNKVTGGGRYESGLLDIAPASLENLARGYGGGPVSFTLDILNAIYVRQSIKRQDLDARRLPFVKQLYGEIDAESDRVVGTQRMDAARKVIDPIKQAQSDGAPEVREMMQRAGPIASLGGILAETQAHLSRVRKEELATMGAERLSEAEKFARLQALAQQRRVVLQNFNRVYDEATLAQAASKARRPAQPVPAMP